MENPSQASESASLALSPQTGGNPAAARHVLIAANPIAGARSAAVRVQELASELEGAGYHVATLYDIEQVAEQARTLHELGQLQAVVAAGGDGTVRLVVDHTGEGMPIAILPQGTENLLVRQLNLPWEPWQIAQAIRTGGTVRLDAGRANGRLFLLMVGVGFDAEVVERVHRNRRGHITHGAYVKPVLRAIRSYRYPKMRVYFQREEQPGDFLPVDPISARWVFVMNMPHYALRLPLAPEADPADGRLDLCVFAGGSLLRGLYYLSRVVLGRHGRLSDCTMARTTRLRIESDEPVPYQMDGDPGGQLPLEIEIVPGRFTLVAPSGSAVALPSGETAMLGKLDTGR